MINITILLEYNKTNNCIYESTVKLLTTKCNLWWKIYPLKLTDKFHF